MSIEVVFADGTCTEILCQLSMYTYRWYSQSLLWSYRFKASVTILQGYFGDDRRRIRQEKMEKVAVRTMPSRQQWLPRIEDGSTGLQSSMKRTLFLKRFGSKSLQCSTKKSVRSRHGRVPSTVPVPTVHFLLPSFCGRLWVKSRVSGGASTVIYSTV